MSMLNDQQARQQAIDPHQSFAVSAPAGSGKTELLIQRTLSLLSRVEQPEAILGITFTRKAANEMRERVSKALSKAHSHELLLTHADSGQPGSDLSGHEKQTLDLALAALKRDRELGWGLLNNPNRLRFQTIDGLCRQLANQLCLETGIVIPPDMTDDPKELCQAAAERLIDYLEDAGPTGESLRILVAHLDGNLEKLVDLVKDLLASRDSWLPIIVPGQIDEDYLQERVGELVEESLLKTAESLLPYMGELEELLDFACRYREGASWLSEELFNEVPEVQTDQLLQWKALGRFLLTNSGEFRGSVDKRLGFPTQSDDLSKAEAAARKEQMGNLLADMATDTELKTQLQRIAILPEMDKDQSGPINQALFRLLPVAAAEFDLLSQERGEADYTAVAMAALEALGTPEQPTPLALRLDYRVEHILVDEFQDTSSMQVELLRRLTAGWQEGDGRSLFIVGDGMQSIYGFRKANVSLFIRARRDGIEHVKMQPIDLTANFRSDQQIVNWVNASFSRIFPEQDNLVQGQVAFRQAQATRSSTDWPIQLNGYASEWQEAEHIAADIHDKLQVGETSIAILVRGRSHLREILPALRAREIQWQAQQIDQLAGRMAVMDIHSLTRALCCPADRIAWLSLLRAPWAGLNMADLLFLANDPVTKSNEEPVEEHPDLQGNCSIWTLINRHQQNGLLSPEARQTCDRLLSAFGTAYEQLDSGHGNLRNIVEQLWLSLDADQGLLEARDLEDIDDYLDLLEQMESGGAITDWIRFEQKLGELYAKPATTDNSVQIMTIHSAKGLEFDHVYLPGTHRQPGGSNEAPLLLWWQREFESGQEAYLLSAKPALSNEKVQDLYAYLKAEENERQRQETARLLYVATTRARKSLFISGKLNWDEQKEKFRAPDSRTMLSILWALYEEEFTRNADMTQLPSSMTEENENPELAGIRRLPPERPLPSASGQSAPEKIPVSTAHAYHTNYQSRLCGDLIHHSLMRIVREHISQPVAGLFVPDWQKGLSARGLTSEQQQDALEQLGNMLSTVLADETGRWLLDWNHEQSGAELEMDYLNDFGGLQRAIIDRTFVDQGTRWIIDYKSSSPSENQSLENFLEQEARVYQPQLSRYASLFSEPVKTMLYFPAIPASTEINLGSE
jgi:ATP-dependent exoDNAse (exonuclease V) beta subunit